MDIATIIGYVLGVGFLVSGIGVASVPGFIDIPSMLIVGGGSCGAVIISFPMEHLKKFINVTKNAWLHTAQHPIEMIKRMVEFAEVARRDGILALENVTENIEDEFLVCLHLWL